MNDYCSTSDRVLFDTESLTAGNGHYTDTDPVRSFHVFLACLDLDFISNVFPWTYHRWVHFFLANLPVRDCVRPLTDTRGTAGLCLWWTSRVICVWALWSRLIRSHEAWARLTAVICSTAAPPGTETSALPPPMTPCLPCWAHIHIYKLSVHMCAVVKISRLHFKHI